MNRKKIIRMSVDISMTILMFVQMAYHLTGNILHEVLGVLLFLLFTIHHMLNIGWYHSLFRGRYTPLRILMTAVNTLLFICIVCLMVSGIMLSQDIFAFLSLRAGLLGRRMHLIASAWAYILISAHIGLHWGAMASNLKLKAAFARSIALVMSLYGVYALVRQHFYERLLLISDYAFFDYDQLPLFFFTDYLAIMALFPALSYYFSKVIRISSAGGRK